MSVEFKLAHVGLNCGSPREAEALAGLLGRMFDLPGRATPVSHFAGDAFECMNDSSRGTNGHIAMGTNDIFGAMELLRARGFTFDESSAAYTPEGKLFLIYLDGEFGGFAVHLFQL